MLTAYEEDEKKYAGYATSLGQVAGFFIGFNVFSY